MLSTLTLDFSIAQLKTAMQEVQIGKQTENEKRLVIAYLKLRRAIGITGLAHLFRLEFGLQQISNESPLWLAHTRADRSVARR
jgi:hypothetical protein